MDVIIQTFADAFPFIFLCAIVRGIFDFIISILFIVFLLKVPKYLMEISDKLGSNFINDASYDEK